MELSKNDTKVLKGLGIILMVLLHLFARKDVNGLYETFPLINDVPLAYYIGLLGDACRPIYLFVTGYAFFIMINKTKNEEIWGKNVKRIFKLFINYWTVFILFVPLGFLIGSKQTFTPSITNFLLNLFGLSNSYNGAWWFLQIYIIFVLISPILIRIVRKQNSFLIFLISGLLYFLAYVQRFKTIVDFGEHPLSIEIIRILVLIGTSQFSFIIGSLFAKEKIYTMIHRRLNHLKYKNVFCICGFLFLILLHGIVESAIIAPINGITFICLYLLMDKSIVVHKVLDFISNHSTNIWLTHMFFYSTIFQEVIFFPKYPILIFIWLLFLCIISSFIIQAIMRPIIKRIDKKKVEENISLRGTGYILK